MHIALHAMDDACLFQMQTVAIIDAVKIHMHTIESALWITFNDSQLYQKRISSFAYAITYLRATATNHPFFGITEGSSRSRFVCNFLLFVKLFQIKQERKNNKNGNERESS